jgi:hypothetical protein
MNKIVVAALLSAFIAAPAFAADGKNSVGITYGLDLNGVVGVQGEFDVSSMLTNKAPVSVQVFWKNYSQSFGGYQYSYNGFGAAAIYDFGPVIETNSKIRPYAGLGLITLNSSLSGPNADTPGLRRSELQQFWRINDRRDHEILSGRVQVLSRGQVMSVFVVRLAIYTQHP